MDVFSFGISQGPKSVKETLAQFNESDANIDYFVFHQANMQMNEMIRKKLKLPPEKVPYSLADYREHQLGFHPPYYDYTDPGAAGCKRK